MKEYHLLAPQKLAEVFNHVKETMPDSFRDPNVFAQVYWAKSSMFFELGQMEGAFWFVNISIGWKATIHIAIWGERLRHQANTMRKMLLEVMDLLQLSKVEAYMPVTNIAVLRFAEKAGFHKEGLLLQWDYYDNEPVDIAVYSIVKEN